MAQPSRKLNQRSIERAFLLLVSLVLALLFVNLYNVLQTDFAAVPQRLSKGTMVDLNAPNATADLPAGLSQADFDAAVIEERNRELSFEYDRWFDIVRKRLLPTVFAGRDDILANYSDEDYLYPIPVFDAQTLGSQNPGYAISE